MSSTLSVRSIESKPTSLGMDERQFLANALVQDAVLRQLMVVNLEVVWSIVVEELPNFHMRMQALLDKLKK